jgi:2-polyprenyl-3-methyl-5-hydroxy-6-metoxy-1,4-benzoquinol methylase
MKNFTSEIRIKDHSVSGEEFVLRYNKDFQCYETYPKLKEENLSKYYQSEDYISHTDSKRNLREMLYHRVRNLMMRRKLKLISSLENSNKSLLDIGCGTGEFLRVCKKSGWHVEGVEPNEDARSIALNKVDTFIRESIESDALKEGSYDVITLWHVLEHMPDIEKVIRRLSFLLKPSGHIIVAVPNYRAYDAIHYKAFWAAYDVPRHVWHFSQFSIKAFFKKENFKLLFTKGMWFDSFYVSILSESYKFANPFNFILGSFFGLVSNLKAMFTGEYSSLIYVLKKEI